MRGLLDSHVNNLSEIDKETCIKCQERNNTIQKCEFVKLKENRLMYRWTNCNDLSFKPVEPLIQKFSNTYRLCDKDNNKFILLLRKSVYPYEYIDNETKFEQTVLPSKNKFYSNVHKTDISDRDYNHALKVWNTFNIKNFGEYHDFYVQSDTLLLSNVSEAFRNTCIKEYELDSTYFVSAPGLSWITCLKLTNVKLELLTDID